MQPVLERGIVFVPITILPTEVCTLWLDGFTGAASGLDDHVPDIGGMYIADGGGSLAATTIDGSGNLNIEGNVYATSALDLPPRVNDYTLEATVTLSAIGADYLNIDLAGSIRGSLLWPLELFLVVSASQVTLQGMVWGIGWTALYDTGSHDITSLVTIGAPFVMQAVVTPTGTVFKLGETVIGSTDQVPTLSPALVEFGIYSDGGSSSGSVDYVQMTSPQPCPAIVPCCAVPAFTWAQFVSDLNVSNIETTLRDETLDNVQMNVQLGGPMSAWATGAGIHAGWIDGAIGGAYSGEYRIPFALKLTNGQPDYDNLGVPRPDLASKPAYGEAVAYTALGQYGTNPAAFVTGIAQFAGVAVDGEFQQYWYTETVAETLSCQAWLSTNPSATNAAKGYPGYFWFYNGAQNNLSLISGAVLKIDDFRCGLVDVDYEISDAFDVARFRAGLHVVKTGTGYDVDVLSNGAVEATHSLTGTSLVRVYWNPITHSPPANGAGNGQLTVSHDIHVGVDADEFTYFSGGIGSAAPAIIDAACMKFAQYVKPNASNAGRWSFSVQFSMLTDPAYVLGPCRSTP